MDINPFVSSTRTTTPATISADVKRLCAKINDLEPFYVPVKPMEGFRPQFCFQNVRELVRLHGGDIVYGWIIWENPGNLLEAEFHSVWRIPGGELVDVTPLADNEQQVLFLPDTQRTWTGQLINNIRLPLNDSAYVKKMVSDGERWHNFRAQQYKPGGLMWSQFQNADKYDPCPCQSGFRFDACCWSLYRS